MQDNEEESELSDLMLEMQRLYHKHPEGTLKVIIYCLRTSMSTIHQREVRNDLNAHLAAVLPEISSNRKFSGPYIH